MSLEFDPLASLIVVSTRLCGPAAEAVAELALDTGSTFTVVHAEILNFIGCGPSEAAEKQQVLTGSKAEIAPQVFVGEIEALGQVKREFPVLCHCLPVGAEVDGVLGLDFFRGHRVLIDLRDGRVTVE
jgi:hypothetical protein